MSQYIIGVDVGGTNTDAVILNENMEVIAETKEYTQKNINISIDRALQRLISQTDIPLNNISQAMLGTTHCTNAIVERRSLNKVGVIRIGSPAGLAVEPLIDFPEELRLTLNKHVHLIGGGHEFDGREIGSLDEDALYKAAQNMVGEVDSVAITSIFSPVIQDHEQRAKGIIREVLGTDIPVSLSSEIGSVGLIERENATILNASVVNVAKAMANGFVDVLAEKGIHCSVHFSQNDGTLMSYDYAVKYPIYTIACGPTNSLRGASYLANAQNGIVVDVGGTTTDVGVLIDTFPRESSLAVEIGGVRTNFRMPDLVSIGLGGGTIIQIHDDDSFQIGPSSVGYLITEKALVFGGDTLTATDVAVCVGNAHIGNPTYVEHLNKKLMQKIYDKMIAMTEAAIEKIKTSPDQDSVIFVGGGSVLFPDSLKGASTVLKPKNSGVANAIGSAISQVSGQVERIYMMDEEGREATLEQAKQLAIQEAVDAGAEPSTCKIVELEDVPLAYLPGNATRIKVKATGDLKQ